MFCCRWQQKTSHRRYYMQMSDRIRLWLRNNYIRIARWRIHHRINEACVLANDVPTLWRNTGISFVRLQRLELLIRMVHPKSVHCAGQLYDWRPFATRYFSNLALVNSPPWSKIKNGRKSTIFLQRIPCKQAGSAFSFCERKRVYGLYVHTQKQWNICYPWKKPVVVSL